MVPLDRLFRDRVARVFAGASRRIRRTPGTFNHYAVGWAHAMNTPYQWTKQVASHFGGTRNGTIVHWPPRSRPRARSDGQFCHVIDVAPAVLEVAGLPQPIGVNGVPAKTARGREPGGLVRRRRRRGTSRDPVLEMIADRGIYPEGSTAVTRRERVARDGVSPPRATGRLGALRPTSTGRRPTISPRKTRRSSRSSSGSG